MIETEFWFQTRGQPEKGIRRKFATEFAGGHSPANTEIFFQVIKEEPKIKSLVLKPGAVQENDILARIKSNGFHDIGVTGRYRIFIRK